MRLASPGGDCTRSRRGAGQPQHLPAVVLAEVDRLAHVAVGLVPRLARLEALRARRARRGAGASSRAARNSSRGPLDRRRSPPGRRGRHGRRDGRVGVGRGARRRGGDDHVGIAAGSTDVMVAAVRTCSPSISAGTSMPGAVAATRSTATREPRRGPTPRRHSRSGSGSYGRRARRRRSAATGGASVGPGELGRPSGAATSSSSARPSAKRWRTKLSLDVFSSRRRTRYAMPGHQLAHRPVHAQAQPEPLDGGVHGLGHAVEQLHLVAVVGDAPMACVAHGVGERAQVVGAEGGPHLAVVVVQEPDAALVVGVGLVLVLEHRRRPAVGPGVDGLGVPVRALHQAHGDRADARSADQAMRSARSSRASRR